MIKPHEFLNKDGEVLVLRCINKDGTSYGGFKNPTAIVETVEAPDWKPSNKCGKGIHGWPWGSGLGDGKEPDYFKLWQVVGVKPADGLIGEIGGELKCKFKRGILRYSGDWAGAFALLLNGRIELTQKNADGSSATGYRSASSATGDNSVAVVTGLCGKAMAGEYGYICLAFEKNGKRKIVGAAVGGRGNLKPHVWYKLNSRGKFVEDK